MVLTIPSMIFIDRCRTIWSITNSSVVFNTVVIDIWVADYTNIMISIHFNENLNMQQCNKILRKKYRTWQWGAFWEGRVVVGSNLITQIYFPALRTVENILKNTLPHWRPVHISCSVWGPTEILLTAWYAIFRIRDTWFELIWPPPPPPPPKKKKTTKNKQTNKNQTKQNTWIVLLWWWNLKKHDYVIWEKMLCSLLY